MSGLRSAFIMLCVLAAALGPRAMAAIGDAPDTILAAIASYGPSRAEDGTYRAASDVAFRIDTSNGIAIRVNGQAQLNDANVRFVSDLLAAATGYGQGIAGPIAEYLRTRVADLVGQGPTAVGVEEYSLSMTVTGDAPYQLGFVLEPQQVSADLFPPGRHSIGPADAKHVIREFSDFQCPFCDRFAMTVMPELRTEVLQDGDVRFEFHQFPLKSIHANAFAAAEASECVTAEAGPDAFWVFHDALFGAQQQWEGLHDPVDAFVSLATDAGIEAPGLADCVRSGTYSDLVESAYQTAVETLRLTGTPTVFVDGLRVADYTDVASYKHLMTLSDALRAAADTSADAGSEP